MRQVRPDPARRLDEIEAVGRVLLEPGRDGEDVRVEDDVLGRQADRVHQGVVATPEDLGAPLERIGLTLLVEGHHHDRCAVAAGEARLPDELRLAFLERDRVHHRLALDALEAGLDDRPLRAIDHHRHARDVGLGGDEVEERSHGGLRVEHRLVHVDVDHLRAVLDLLARDCERLLVVAGEDEPRERLRAGDVGALADVDEERVLADVHRLEAGEPQPLLDRRHLARRDAAHMRGNRGDVLGRRAAAAADDVEEPGLRELLAAGRTCAPASRRSRSPTAGSAGRRSDSSRCRYRRPTRARRCTAASASRRARS